VHDDSMNRPLAGWRTLVAAVLTFGAAAVTVFACLSGPSSAAPVSDPSSVSGVNQRVPAGMPGAIGGDVGSALVE
jgi:hypothetical protein